MPVNVPVLMLSVDLRSDTITKPTPGMLDAMLSASTGDDVFGEDPTVAELERRVAHLFGKEAGLFCPSGTMTNQIALKVLTRPQEELICDQSSHVYLYEGGGAAFNSGLSVWLLNGDRGRLRSEEIRDAIRPENVHYPRTSLVALENTHNRGGGSIYEISEMEAIRKVCDEHHLGLHLDGARIFNALAEADYSAPQVGQLFDTISVCLSKGLGAPVGSVLTASKALINEARRVRKVMGGGMRQAGYLAAAGIYALDHHIKRLRDDHRRARQLENILKSLSFIEEVVPVQTNIVVSRLSGQIPTEQFLNLLETNHIKAVAFGKQQIRMVTHLDFNDEMLAYVEKTLKQF